jgi:hypothetical protein
MQTPRVCCVDSCQAIKLLMSLGKSQPQFVSQDGMTALAVASQQGAEPVHSCPDLAASCESRDLIRASASIVRLRFG